MPIVLFSLLKTLWVFGGTAVLAACLSRQRAAVRRRVWLAAFIATPVLLVLQAPALRPPPIALGTLPPLAAVAARAGAAIAPREAGAATSELLPSVLAGAWALVAGALLLRAIIGQAGVRRILRQRRAPSETLKTELAALGVEAWLVEHPAAPFTAGLLRPVIALPHDAAEWTEVQLRAALTHELGHAQARDPLWRLFTDVMLAVIWPNPLAWYARKRLELECELACDEAVIASGIRHSDYARFLLARATTAACPSPGMAAARSLTRRIEHALAPLRPSGSRLVRALPALATLMLAAFIACSELSPSSQAPQPQPPQATEVATIAPAPTPPAPDRARAKDAFERGNQALRADRVTEAVAAYTQALEASPEFAAPHRGLGIAQARLGNGDAAVEHYKAYLRLAPNAPDAPSVRMIIAEYEATE